MDENNSDMGDDEIEELNESDLEEVFVDDLLGVEGDNDEPDVYHAENDEREAPVRDDADFVFRKHTDSVFCVALDPKNCNLAVSGGQDEAAYVWEIEQGEVLFECYGHKDSVTMASFNHNGTYVATGDMGGLIRVWKVETKEMVWCDSIGDLSWMRWHHSTNALLCATLEGVLYLWKIPAGICKVLAHSGIMTEYGIFMPDGRRLAVGYSFGEVKVYDLNGHQAVQGSRVHLRSVNCIDTHTDNNIIASCGNDGNIALIKTQPFKVLWVFNCPENGDNTSSLVETVVFSKDPSLPLVAAGTVSGDLFILDFAKETLRHHIKLEAGISRMLWVIHESTLFVGGLDGTVRIFNGRNGLLTDKLSGHHESILDINLSVDGHTLVTSSDDKTCRVFTISYPDR